MEKEKISIIVPVYNTNPEFLERCIESIVQQSYSNLEIIVVDDGSSVAETLQCVAAFEETDERLHIIHQKNQGASAARKQGVDAATGEFLTFVDSDDIIHKNACLYMHQLMIREGCQLVEIAAKEVVDISKCDWEEESMGHHLWLTEGKEELLDALVQNCQIPLGWFAWGKLYKTEIMKQSYQTHPGIYRGEDTLTVVEYLLLCNKTVSSNRKLYFYNKGNPESATAQQSIRNLSLCRYTYELMKIYQMHGSERAYCHARAMYCDTLFGSLLLCEYNRYPDFKSIKKKIREQMWCYKKDIMFNPFVTKRWKVIIALICPKVFYIQHRIRNLWSILV